VSRGLKAILVSVLILLLVSLGATLGYFLIQNGSWVIVRFPTAQVDLEQPLSLVEYETPLAVVMAVSMGVGFLLAVVIFFPSWIRRVWERSRERRFITGLEDELTDLRNLPVNSPAPLEDLPDPADEEGKGERKSKVMVDEDTALLAAALRETNEDGGPGGGASERSGR